MSDNVRILPGVAAPTPENNESALNTLAWLYEEVQAGRITSALVTTLSPADDAECYIINVGHTNKLKFYGLIEVLRRFIQES